MELPWWQLCRLWQHYSSRCWKRRVIRMATVSSMTVLKVTIMKTYSVESNDKVGIVITLHIQLISTVCNAVITAQQIWRRDHSDFAVSHSSILILCSVTYFAVRRMSYEQRYQWDRIFSATSTQPPIYIYHSAWYSVCTYRSHLLSDQEMSFVLWTICPPRHAANKVLSQCSLCSNYFPFCAVGLVGGWRLLRWRARPHHPP